MDELLNSLITPSQEQLQEAKIAIEEFRQKNQQEQHNPNMAAAAIVPLPDSEHEIVLPHRTSIGQAARGEQPAPLTSSDGDSIAASGIRSLGELFASRTDPDIALELQSIEDFELQNPYQPNPPAKVVPLPSSKGNYESTVKLHHLCDQRGVRPEFTYNEPSAFRFSAKVEIGSLSFQTPNSFPTKKQAKDAACSLALSEPSNLDAVAGVKRKAPLVADVGPEVDRSEDWISILHDYAQRKKVAFAEYHESMSENPPFRFGCTVNISGGPAEPFGQDLGPFNSKQAARTSAAKEAVLWLRAQGVLRAAPSKRARPEFQDVVNKSLQEVDSAPLPVRVHHLVAALGFSQPRFDCRLSKTKLGDVQVGVPIYDAAVFFDERDVVREPRLAGPIGRVEQVHGQKKAKEACYEQLLITLQQIQSSRGG
ncbi:uncharacterized protein LTR77_004337 [Saxophila tyrrhenica]|uniref:DRBM domain-containing protein n=1 Tax=Saxophila tyrrhenica TaxID=1690608 RepID=A0AAV9PGP9_9PEZI|nr:hypothetical protein LTR77_004337 [Saxophila tyrrhenica]